MSDRPAIIAGLLGTPYDKVERHCWWLATLVERDVFGRDLPAGPGADPGRHERSRLLANHPARQEWQAHPAPNDGDLVLMGRVEGKDIHCGVYLADHRGIIHTDEPHGVVIDTVLDLQQVRRWRVSYYRPSISA